MTDFPAPAGGKNHNIVSACADLDSPTQYMMSSKHENVGVTMVLCTSHKVVKEIRQLSPVTVTYSRMNKPENIEQESDLKDLWLGQDDAWDRG